MPYIFFTQFWITTAMGRVSETFVQKLHIWHRTGMRCFVANSVLLVSLDAHVVTQCRSTEWIQYLRRIGIVDSMVSRVYLYGPGHHIIGQNCLHYGHISVYCVNYILLSWHNVARCFTWYYASFYTAMGIVVRSGCLVGGRHTNIFFAWIGLRRFDCIQVCPMESLINVKVFDEFRIEHCSSYNPANNNCYRDALLVSFTNCGTSMFAGVVVFAVIGFKATSTYEQCLSDRSALSLINSTNLPVCDLQRELDNVNSSWFFWYRAIALFIWLFLFQSASGTGLAFIIFTEAINQFPGAQLWAVLFFLMLFTLGIDSQFGMLEGLATSLVDMKLFPSLPKDMIIGVICYCLQTSDNLNISMRPIVFHAFTDFMHILLCYIGCICSWCWQLHLSADGQFCRQLLTTNYCFIWMHCSELRVRYQKVSFWSKCSMFGYGYI